MKLSSIYIKNFRSLRDVRLDMDAKSTVIFGMNGAGKSSVLRAVNLGFVPVINRVVGRNEYQQTLRFIPDDISIGERYCTLELNIDLDGDILPFSRKYGNKRGEHSSDNRELKAVNERYQSLYASDPETSVPVYVNYGTNRIVLDVPLTNRKKHSFEKFSAYEHAVQNQIDFKTFFEWFRNQEDYENSEKVARGELSYKDRALDAVRRAVSGMLDRCEDIHVERKPRLALVVVKDGMKLNISQLSDGEKCTMALFGDLARRLSVANPSSDDPLTGEGIVLIDELELHMHPSWQRIILGRLRNTFPNIQFIVTTHSPLVLSEISNDYALFSIMSEHNISSVTPVRNLDGQDVNTILESYMKTSHESYKSKEARNRLGMALRSNDREQIEQAVSELAELAGYDDPDIIEAKLILARKEREHEIHQ